MGTENTPSNPLEGVAEQVLVDKVEAAIVALQQAQAMFTNTLEALAQHDIGDSVHLDIRQEILAIKVGTGFITLEAAIQRIAEAIDAHDESNQAHSRFDTQIDELITRIATLEIKVAALEPTGADPNMTELERRLKEIDDYYDPTLAALLQAWTVASMGGLATADVIADEYQALMNAKATARADVLREFDYA